MLKTLLFIVGLSGSISLHAQEPGAVKQDTLANRDKNFTFRVMPFMSYNRNLQFMIGAIPMFMYRLNKNDRISPKSLSGLAGVYTTNNSYFISAFNRFFLKEDKWRITLFGVTGVNNSQFFMDNLETQGFYQYSTETTILSGGFQRRINRFLFAGLSYTYSYFYTEYEDEIAPPSRTHTNGIQLSALFDTRNEIYYPNKGVQARLKWMTLPKWFANDTTANKIQAEYNQYFAIRKKKDVIAVRFSGLFGLGAIAFEQQETIGGKDIRGYSEGKYRGDGILSVQGEYRYNFHRKLGVVGFAGIATLYGSDTDSFNWNLYPGVGAGFRYKTFEDVHFNIGLDAAVGKDDWGIYFRIGEAF